MFSLVEDVKNWNNPALGAYYLWCFTKGYTEAHSDGSAPVALLHFLATAILTNSKLSEPISGRRSGLQSYVKSFEEHKRIDQLILIHDLVARKKKYTLDSIDLAVSRGFLFWDGADARIYHKEITKKAGSGNALKPEIKRAGKRAEILGQWFAEYEISQISSLLKVVF